LKAVRHIFFDLDNTLWDFERNSAAVLQAVYDQFQLGRFGIPSAQAFVARYHVHNDMAWKAYREGRMDQETLRWERYWRTLAEFGCEDRRLAMEMSAAYLDTLATQQHLMPGAMAALEALRETYPMHIITNGFEEVQHRKLRYSGLAPFFRSVTTAEDAGMAKPDPRIFALAMQKAEALPEHSLYVGDHWHIDGSALQAGMHFVHVDYAKASAGGRSAAGTAPAAAGNGAVAHPTNGPAKGADAPLSGQAADAGAQKTAQKSNSCAVLHSLHELPALLGLDSRKEKS
jgi:putative hydrolase of the HAD superfamily